MHSSTVVRSAFLVLVPIVVSLLYPFSASAEDVTGPRVAPFTPKQRVSVERRYHAIQEGRGVNVDWQIVESAESVETLSRKLSSTLGGKYHLYYYPPFYVIRDDGIPVPEDTPYVENLDIPISVQLKDVSVWDALVAWNSSLNERLVKYDLTNKVGWEFVSPFGPRVCFDVECVSIDVQDVKARDVLLEIMRQAPVVMSYSYFGAEEGDYAGKLSVVRLTFYSSVGQRVQYQNPDGSFWFPENPDSVVEEVEQAPRGTLEENREWHLAFRNVLNRHLYEKVELNRPPVPNTAEVERDRQAALFAADAEKFGELSEVDRAKREALVKEAKIVYESFFATTMAAGDHEQLSERLMMYGRPVSNLVSREIWPDLRANLTGLNDSVGLLFENGGVEIDMVNYDFAAIGNADFLIRLPIEASEVLAIGFLTHIEGNPGEDYLKNSITVEEGVGVFLLMRKKDGVWYWNPIGW